MDRRTFLKIIGTGVAGATTGDLLTAENLLPGTGCPKGILYGILVDTGAVHRMPALREACAEVNGLTAPDISEGTNDTGFKSLRQITDKQYTVTNKFMILKRAQSLYRNVVCIVINRVVP